MNPGSSSHFRLPLGFWGVRVVVVVFLGGVSSPLHASVVAVVFEFFTERAMTDVSPISYESRKNLVEALTRLCPHLSS